MSSIVLKKNEDDRDMITNIMNFFHESVINFKKILYEMSESIDNFLKSLETIEGQLEIHGYNYQEKENSSDLLYERLTKNKKERETQQKELILKLTDKVKDITKEEPINYEKNIKKGVNLSPPPKIEELINIDQSSQLNGETEVSITKLKTTLPIVEGQNHIKIVRTPTLVKDPVTIVHKKKILKSADEFSKNAVVTDGLRKEMLRRLKELREIMKNQ